jgi:hypothetical protein
MHLAYDFAALQSSHKLEAYATEHLGTLRRLTGKWADPRSASILACDRGVPQFSRKLEACASVPDMGCIY